MFEKQCDLPALGRFGLRLFLFGLCSEIHRRRDGQTNQQHRHDCGGGGEGQLVSLRGFLKTVEPARWSGGDRFVVQMAADVRRQTIGGFVTARAVFLQALHHDPVQVATQSVDEFLETAFPLTRASDTLASSEGEGWGEGTRRPR